MGYKCAYSGETVNNQTMVKVPVEKRSVIYNYFTPIKKFNGEVDYNLEKTASGFETVKEVSISEGNYSKWLADNPLCSITGEKTVKVILPFKKKVEKRVINEEEKD